MKNVLGMWLVCGSVVLLTASTVVADPTFSLKAVKKNPTCLTGGGICLGGAHSGTSCSVDANCDSEVGAGDGVCGCRFDSDCDEGECGGNITPTNNLSVNPGDIVVAEIFASDWSPEGQALRFWQATISLHTFLSGTRGMILPLGWDRPVNPVACTSDEDCAEGVSCYFGCTGDPSVECEEDDDCTEVGGTCEPRYCDDLFETTTCSMPDGQCEEEGLECFVTYWYCAGPNHNPDHGATMEVDAWLGVEDRENYIFYHRTDIPSTGTLEYYMYGATLIYPHEYPVYESPPKYCGTLALIVSDNPCGKFTFSFLVTEPSGVTVTFFRDRYLYIIEPLVTESLILDTGPCECSVEATDPSNCAIDARQPSDPSDPNTAKNPDGWNSIDFIFNEECDVSGMTSADFAIRQEPPTGLPNAIIGVTPHPADHAVTVNFIRTISLQKWTCVKYKRTAHEVCIAPLPADVNGDGTSAAADVLAMIDCLNSPPCEIWQCDVDRSGGWAPADILRVIDLLNGADEFAPWLGGGMELNTACPTE